MTYMLMGISRDLLQAAASEARGARLSVKYHFPVSGAVHSLRTAPSARLSVLSGIATLTQRTLINTRHKRLREPYPTHPTIATISIQAARQIMS
ncbi:hypothetical protein J6590_046734 [Homalodisca vitripennis]|nr:hypothetical protein J6590_046734 [Homalodisca vitripennis]